MWASSGFTTTGTEGGGGFMNSPSTQNKRQENRHVHYVTVNSVLNELDDSSGRPELNGVPLSTVCIVATVATVNKEPAKITFGISDDSCDDSLDIQFFTDEDNAEKNAVVQVGSLLKVYGSVRTFQKKVYILALNFLSATPKDSQLHKMQVKLSKSLKDRNNRSGLTEITGFGNEPMNGGDMYGKKPKMESNSNGGLTSIQNKCLQLIAADSTAMGISFTQIMTACQGVPESQVRSTVDFLSNEGHIYTTTDDNHFKLI